MMERRIKKGYDFGVIKMQTIDIQHFKPLRKFSKLFH
jgi:hypothetical protein